MRYFIAGAVLACALLMVGCAHVPNATVHYYLPQTSLNVKVVRTVACDAANHILAASALLPTTTNTAGELHEISLSKFNRFGSDLDTKFDFYEDGRLKALNATMTGQGEATVKAIVSLSSAAFTLSEKEEPPSYPDLCGKIRTWGDKKPLTLTYASDLDVTSKDCQPLVAAGDSDFYAASLSTAIGTVCARLGVNGFSRKPFTYAPSADDHAVKLALREPALKLVDAEAAVPGKPPLILGVAKVQIAQAGTDYELLIPEPALFGKQVFAASFSEAGALTSLQYVKNSGAAEASNAASSLASLLKNPTTADKAAQVKAEADLLAEQQRLVQCRADPKNCK